jgi:hypothetical protein
MGASDNDLKYRAEKGDGFAKRVDVRRDPGDFDIVGPGITSSTPLRVDPHATGLGASVIQTRWNSVKRGR